MLCVFRCAPHTGMLNASYTVEFWLQLAAREKRKKQTLISFSSPIEAKHNRGFEIAIKNGKSFLSHYDNDLIGSPVLASGWCHLAFTFDRSQREMTILHNGKVVSRSKGHDPLVESCVLHFGPETKALINELR
jgi:hypothetical protein